MIQPGCALVWLLKAGKHVHKRRLTCTVRADQTDQLCPLKLKGDALKRPHPAEMDGHISCLKCRHAYPFGVETLPEQGRPEPPLGASFRKQ